MFTDNPRQTVPAGTVRLRAAAAGDLAGVMQVVKSAGLITGGLEDQFPGAYVVAVADADTVGAAGLEVYGRSGFLRSVAVRNDWRGAGLGRRLVADRLAAARALHLDAVYLLTDTAAGFFRREGFLPLSREAVPAEVRAAPEFASLCPASSHVLGFSLGAP